MLFLTALVLAQSAYSPEIEAVMRNRDEKRAAETRSRIEKAAVEKSTADAQKEQMMTQLEGQMKKPNIVTPHGTIPRMRM